MPRTLALVDLVGGADAALHDRWERAVRRELHAHSGREIDKTDGFLLLFDDVAGAYRWAAALHRALPGRSRVGVHLGPVLLRENSQSDVALGAKPLEVDGLAKPLTARVMAIARGGQTLLTAEAVAALALGGLEVVSHGHWQVKGVAEPIELFEAGGDEASFEPPPDAAKSYRVVRGADGWIPVRELPRALPADRPVVGRGRLLREIAAAFRDGAASVALVGAPGNGRSRVALRYAWAWLGEHPGGAWAVGCAGGDGDEVSRRIRERVPEDAGRCLVLLDDLAPELVGPTLDRWRERTPDARFLVTTSEVVATDRVFEVPPLDVADAVVLFETLAREADRGYDPTDEDRAVLAELVEVLGRTPRAIEEAARRARLMSPRALLAHHRQTLTHPVRLAVDPDAAPGQTAADPVRALLVTDVVGSTILAESLGDAAMARLWAEHDRVARDLLRVHRGREIDRTDGLLLMFDTAGDALAYADAYHTGLAALDPPLRARAGLHQGPVKLRVASEEEAARGAKPLDVQGPARTVAERVMALAPGGGTLIAAPHGPGVSHGRWRLRGRPEPIVLWGLGAATEPPAPGRAAWPVEWVDGLWVPTRPPPHRLPAERDVFVGREADLADLNRRLDDGARLVSVLGVGGTGKTRLALRLARARLGEHPGGVVFCSLGEARDAPGITRATARALEVSLGTDDPVSRVADALLGRGEILVVLDNFEQVARYAEETLGVWLDRAPAARFVVTTREVLGLPGEQAVALTPLDPEDGVALFLERAGPTGVARSTIERVVAGVDGLPLAIELAAARVDQVELLAERLDRAGPEGRQAMLRATLDWSWALLAAPLQDALARLAVFEGGFALDAATAVLDVDAIDALQALVDRSLVRRVGDARFDLLLTVKDYAADRLEASGSRAEAERRYCAWFASYSTHEGERRGPFDLDNLVAATRRATLRGDGDVAADALMGAWGALGLRGPLALGIELAERVGALPDLSRGARARVDFVLARAYRDLHRLDEGRVHLQAALEAFRAGGEARLAAHALGNVGADHLVSDRNADAKVTLLAALDEARASGFEPLERTLLDLVGCALQGLGELDEAMSWYERALRANRAAGDRLHEGWVLCHVGGCHRDAGRFVESADSYREALVASREAGDHTNSAHALAGLGSALGDLGREAESDAALHECIALRKRLGDRKHAAIALGNHGLHLRLRGRPVEARATLEEALATHREVGFVYGQPYWLAGLALLELGEGRLDEALPLAREAAELSAPFPGVRFHLLSALVQVHLARGEVADARRGVEEAWAIDPDAFGAMSFLDVLVSVAEGDRERAARALARAELHDPDSLPGTEIYQLALQARAALA